MKIFLILICVLLIASSFWGIKPKRVKIANKIKLETICAVKTKYDLNVVASSEGYESKKYKELGLTFKSHRKIERDEGRKMLLDVIQIFLDNITNNPEFEPFSFNWPFTEENISVSIINSTIDKSTTSVNEIFSFSLRKKNIDFNYFKPGTEYGLRFESETLDEAKRLASES